MIKSWEQFCKAILVVEDFPSLCLLEHDANNWAKGFLNRKVELEWRDKIAKAINSKLLEDFR